MPVKLRRRRAWVLVNDAREPLLYLRTLIFETHGRDATPNLNEALIYNSRRLASETLRHHLARTDWRVAPVFVAPAEDH